MNDLEIQKEGKMEQSNVVSLNEARLQKAEFKTRDEYSRYLKTLSVEQLHYEQNYLAGVSVDEFFLRGPELLKELSERIDEPQKSKVQAMRDDILERLKS
jgi:hypothetical protein